MEKIFEDKQFHGLMEFFQKPAMNVGCDIYASGWARSPKLWTNILNRFVWDMSNAPPNGQTVRNSYFGLLFSGTEAINLGSTGAVEAQFLLTNPNLTMTWSGSRSALIKSVLSPQSAVSIVAPLIGSMSLFSSEGAGYTLSDYRGFSSEFNSGGASAGTITNHYGFMSDLTTKHANTTITNAWHFYGKGDFPSYFGGDVQVAGQINNPELNIAASTPPTQAELVSGIGAASGTSGNWYVIKNSGNVRYFIFSDGTNYHYNAFTVGA